MALALGGRTVAEWKEVMTEREFLDWCSFYESSPFDDAHRYHRPAALIAHSLGGADMQELVKYLINDMSIPDEDPRADERTLIAFGIKKD